MMRRTKVVCTIGPATQTESVLSQLIDRGANLFRFNQKYNTTEWHNNQIAKIRKISNRKKVATAIVIDVPRTDYNVELRDFDYIALSYLKSSEEVKTLRNKLEKRGCNAKVIAKIENIQAINNLDSIIDSADAIMVARGDLGVQVPIEELGYFQKKIIDRCRQRSKPVIVATQMLLSMTHNDKPTRAEATDVANAVFDGTDALMLSEETAMGNYPIEAVTTMSKIATFCENSGELRKTAIAASDLTEKLVEAAARIASEVNKPPKAIVVFTKSGKTATMLSRYRLGTPIIAISDDRLVLRSLTLSYGVIPFYKQFDSGKYISEHPVFDELIKNKLVGHKDQLMVIHGNNWLKSGSINNISLFEI